MVIKCKGFSDSGIETDITGLIKLLKINSLLGSKGDLKEALEVYLGGPFFYGLKKAADCKGHPWIFSTFDFDRDDEKIDSAGWELDNYLKNPVILWSHDNRIPAIGYSEDVGIKNRKLGGNIIFNEKETDPFGWGIGQRVISGVLRAGSVGFLVKRIELSEAGGKENLIFRNQELLEFSVCNVPSNPFALVQDDKNPEQGGTEERSGSVSGFMKGIFKGR
jgi:phage head maturation protease